MPDQQMVDVYSKDGQFLSQCTMKRARQMTTRQAATWIGKSTVKLLQTDEDRKKLKQAVYRRDEYICYLCELQMWPGHPHLTVDHVIPRIRGGKDDMTNWACCCTECNAIKADSPLETLVSKEKLKQIEARLMRPDIKRRPNGRVHTERLGLLSE